MTTNTTAYPALHNAMWPGLVGKGPDSEPPIDLATMLNLTAAARVDGVRFDGVDLFLSLPHTDIDSSDDDLARLAETLAAKGLLAGSLVAPVWGPTGGGSAMGDESERSRFLTQVRKACRIGRKLRDLKIRQVRNHSNRFRGQPQAIGPRIRPGTPSSSQRLSAKPARLPRTSVSGWPRKARSAGPACTAGGVTSSCWKPSNRPQTLGFQADMAHTMLFTLGYNAPEDALLPEGFDFSEPARLADAYRQVADALRPWTIDFHVAQNDGTVKGSGSHDKTGRHCQPCDPNGKLDIVRDSGAWLRGSDGQPTRAVQHICWDGCMFPNSVMLDPKTWNDVLRVMIAVRDAHGWN